MIERISMGKRGPKPQPKALKALKGSIRTKDRREMAAAAAAAAAAEPDYFAFPGAHPPPDYANPPEDPGDRNLRLFLESLHRSREDPEGKKQLPQVVREWKARARREPDPGARAVAQAEVERITAILAKRTGNGAA
jgi:hypothetical protein